MTEFIITCKSELKPDGSYQIERYRELVRCKYCCYWLPMNRFHEDYHPDYGECELNKWVRSQNWFCADGKRKN